MGIGIVHRKEEGLLALSDEVGRKGGVALHALALEVGRRNLGKVEWERLGRIDVQLADDASAVADFLQTADDIWCVAAIKAELPRSESDLTVLVRIEPGQKCRPRLAAPGLRNIGILEPDSAFCERVQVRCGHIGCPVCADFRAVVFGDDQEDVGPHSEVWALDLSWNRAAC